MSDQIFTQITELIKQGGNTALIIYGLFVLKELLYPCIIGAFILKALSRLVPAIKKKLQENEEQAANFGIHKK